jgi:hypothetical protein
MNNDMYFTSLLIIAVFFSLEFANYSPHSGSYGMYCKRIFVLFPSCYLFYLSGIVLTGDASPVGFVFPEVPLLNTMTSCVQFGPEPLPFISTPEMTEEPYEALEMLDSMFFFCFFFCFWFCLLFIVYCLLFIVYCLLFIVYCLLFIVYCLLFIVYCLLFVVCLVLSYYLTTPSLVFAIIFNFTISFRKSSEGPLCSGSPPRTSPLGTNPSAVSPRYSSDLYRLFFLLSCFFTLNTINHSHYQQRARPAPRTLLLTQLRRHS